MYVVFSHKKTDEIDVNVCITVRVLCGISFHVMAKNRKQLRIHWPFCLFGCKNRNKVLLTSCLLPNASLVVVGQLSVNISFALRARDISTSRLTSNQ